MVTTVQPWGHQCCQHGRSLALSAMANRWINRRRHCCMHVHEAAGQLAGLPALFSLLEEKWKITPNQIDLLTQRGVGHCDAPIAPSLKPLKISSSGFFFLGLTYSAQ